MSEQIIWKPIYLDGSISDYDISNTGLIRNRESDTLRNPSLRNGYYGLALFKHGTKYIYSVHRLVAEYFVPNPDPVNRTYVDHIDGNKQNNHYTNLEWVTAKENKRRAIELGLDNPHHGNQPKGSASGVSTHTEEQAHEICKLLEKGLSYKEIKAQTGIDHDFIRTLKRGHWKHVTKLYKFPIYDNATARAMELRRDIKALSSLNLTSSLIAKGLGIQDPEQRGRDYVNSIINRYNKDKSSSTIPEEECYFMFQI